MYIAGRGKPSILLKDRKKGQSVGSRKMASDRKGYKKAGELAVDWMKSENWSAWMTKCMQFHVPELDIAAHDMEEDEGDDSGDDDDEVAAWGWQVETQNK